MGIYEDYLFNHPDLSNGDIADLIIANEDVNIKRKSILRALQRAQNPPPKIVGNGRRGDSYTIDENEYEFKFNDYEFDVPKEQIAAACAWYVDPNGMNVQQVCDKLWTFYKRDIDEDFMSRIFKCLGITKTSNGLAPHIIADWDEEQVSEFFLKMRREKVEKKLSENEQYKSLYEEECKKTFQVDQFVENISKHLEIGDQPKFKYPKVNLALDHDLVVVLSDWHVGQKSPVYNKDIYQERVDELCAKLNYELSTSTKKVRDIHFLILGDMVDGPMGNMRAEQALEQDLHHEEQIIYTARGIAQVIRQASPAATGGVYAHGIGGNHGRVGPNRNDDPTRFGDKMVYVLAKEMLKGDEKEPLWSIHSKVVASFMVRSTQVLFMHGDRGAKRPKDLVWTHRAPQAKKFAVCTGHFHSVKAEEAEKDIYCFRGGCLCGTEDYAASLGYGCRAAQIMFRVYDDGPRMPIYMPVD